MCGDAAPEAARKADPKAFPPGRGHARDRRLAPPDRRVRHPPRSEGPARRPGGRQGIRRRQCAARSGDDGPDCTVAKCVALTFDGGPSEPTPKLLDILKEKKVHATFFLQGKGHTDTYPDTVLRMSREGHETANHTWSHKVLTELSAEEIEAEMKPVQDDVRRITGRAPVLMRPPQGRTSDDVWP